MLETIGLARSFGALSVLRDVTLTIAAGERRAVIGPNGAGKTTFFNLLSGEVPPSGGRIRFAGQDVTTKGVAARARMGLARSFQRNSLFADLGVGANLAVAVIEAERQGWSLWRPLNRRADIEGKVAAIAAQIGLADRLEQPVTALSYGAQRQLEVGLALAGRPKLLLLDEPTAGMSPDETQAMERLIAALPRSVTVVIIEHDMDVVFGLADRVTVLDAGTVLAEGTPAEIRASAEVRARYLGGAP
ncbi:MAG: ABC transporter ATP-binding protein [Rhodospirillales bacterium]|nr:ABC transporter ATP-binding protein [Rhodospirillales bacterium]